MALRKFRLLAPPGVQQSFADNITGLFSLVMPSPFRPYQTETSEVDASKTEHKGGFIFDLSEGRPYFSDGTNWLTFSLSTHTHTSADITDFAEAVRDRVGLTLVAGTGITVTVDDPADTITIATTITQYTNELAQDAVGGILTDSATIDFTYDDGANSITAIVKDDSVSYAKIQNVSATDRLLGRSSAGAGDVEEIACTAAGRALLDDATNAAQRTTLGFGKRALVKKSANQTAADYTGGTAIAWNAEGYDTDGFHDNATNNSRLTVQADGYVMLTGQIALSSVNMNEWATASITKGGSLDYDGVALQTVFNDALTSMNINLQTAAIPVVAGNYFELVLSMEADASITVLAARSWFAIEVLA